MPANSNVYTTMVVAIGPTGTYYLVSMKRVMSHNIYSTCKSPFKMSTLMYKNTYVFHCFHKLIFHKSKHVIRQPTGSILWEMKSNEAILK